MKLSLNSQIEVSDRENADAFIGGGKETLILLADGSPRGYITYKRLYEIGNTRAEVISYRTSGLDNMELGLLLRNLE